MQWRALRAFLRRAEWPHWPAGEVGERECGCALLVEHNFRPREYLWHRPIAWWMRTFLRDGARVASRAQIRWPLSFMFHVDAPTVKLRGRRFLRAMYRLARHGVNVDSAGRDARFAMAPDAWGHVLERLPLYLFGGHHGLAPTWSQRRRGPRLAARPRRE